MQIAFGIGGKLFAAAGAAKKIVALKIIVPVLCSSRIDTHAADRVGRRLGRGVVRTR